MIMTVGQAAERATGVPRVPRGGISRAGGDGQETRSSDQ